MNAIGRCRCTRDPDTRCIFDAREVMKMSTTKTNAFDSPNTGAIGQAYDGRVEYYSSSVREVNPPKPIQLKTETKLPRVDIVYMYADAPADQIDFLIGKKFMILSQQPFERCRHETSTDCRFMTDGYLKTDEVCHDAAAACNRRPHKVGVHM